MPNESVVGLLTFNPSLICEEGALGRSYSITVGGLLGEIALPSLPEESRSKDNPIDRVLAAPTSAEKWKRGDKQFYWGRPISHPRIVCSVELATLEFTLASDTLESSYQAIYSGIKSWVRTFHDYVALTAGSKIPQSGMRPHGNDYLELYSTGSNELKHLPNTEPFCLYGGMYRSDAAIDQEKLEIICDLCSRNVGLNLEHEILVSSYRAFGNEDYRKAIIEAATALEISLTNRIREEFANQGISFGQKLFQKFRMLAGRFELARMLSIPFPDRNYTSIVIDPRNSVIHKAKFPEREVAKKMIEETEALINIFSPVGIKE